MSIHLIRHAQASHNVDSRRVAGRALSSKLTDLGEEQPKIAANQYTGTRPEVVYSSPATRCLDTAKIFLKELDTDVEIFEDDRLLEMDQGVQVGRIKFLTVINPKNLLKFIVQGRKFSFTDGESFEEVAIRMQDVIDEIKSLHGDKTVLVSTHGLAIRCYLARKKHWTVWHLLLKRVKNVQIISLD